MSCHAGAGVYCGFVLGGCEFVVFVFCSLLVRSRREGSVFVNSEYWLLWLCRCVCQGYGMVCLVW